ncbi:MAG TPA: sugar transferase [Bacilli bacterium]|nr:sugar transferase [Bacilli bacterium]
MKKKPIYSFFKRAFDIFCSLFVIILLSLPMLIVAIAIKIDSKGPVFFKQGRVGKNKKIFKILKFRSMFIDTDPNAPTHQLGNATSHITKVGAFIRKTSIDELPQLFNIFVGQMSFVGPRPALWNQDDLIAERDKYHVNDVKPGLTGLAQISGRDELEIPVKAKFDGEYVEKRGFFYDIGLIFRTVFSVFKHDGVVEGGTGELKKEKKENGEG